MKTAFLDGETIANRKALHRALAEQLDFPAYYGGNLDALFDLLTEAPQRYRVVISGATALRETLGGYYSALLDTLTDAQEAWSVSEHASCRPDERAPAIDLPGEESTLMQSCTHQTVDLGLLEETLQAYAAQRGSLITILQKTQEIYGYVPIDAVYRIAERTGQSPAKVLGVATFYAQFRFQPIGKYLIMLCKGTACYVNGADRILEAVSDTLGIGDNETTADGLFTLSVVSCLGCCSLAPVMMINDKTYGSLTPDKVKKILAELRKEAAE